jgi:uncharacterized protein YbjT (DUF2867 family)
MSSGQRVLATGATGYVGGRLIPRLLEAGYTVRVLARDPRRLQGRPWLEHVEVAQGDILNSTALDTVLTGVDIAYYLVHSMLGGRDFTQRDVTAARSFGRAAQVAGISRIIYLGGLGDRGTALSEHLRSRQETGQALSEAGVPVTEFRAAIIVGSGSVSFEMIRYLSERLPIMICPRWTSTRVQPIAIRNVLDYLVAAIEVPASVGQIVEIGGADVLTYGEMLLGYAHARGLHRWLLPVPVLSPRLSSYWVHWVTPIPAQIARPLIDGLRNEVVVRSPLARTLFPDITLLDYRMAVDLALDRLYSGEVETSWSDALASSHGDAPPVELSTHEGMILEHRQRRVAAPSPDVFRIFTGLGGARGWLYANWLWQVRGMLDRLVGGTGLRRGRRHPDDVRVGDAIDFWRVERVELNRLLRLRAEMKLPGDAWLQFEATPIDHDKTLLGQTAYFAPKGLPGLLYWYTLYPIHRAIFSGLIGHVALQAERLETAEQAQCARPKYGTENVNPHHALAWW